MTERCQHCGGSLIWERDIDSKASYAQCLSCGRVQRDAPQVKTEEETVTEPRERPDWKVRVPKATPNGATNGTATAPTSLAPARTKATVALDEYATRTATYLDLSARYQEAKAKVDQLAEKLAPAKEAMEKARADLDSELSLLDPEGKPKPFSQRVKVRAAAKSALEPRPCKGCGQTMQPKRSNHWYCSEACKMRAYGRRAPEAAAEPTPEPELVEASA